MPGERVDDKRYFLDLVAPGDYNQIYSGHIVEKGESLLVDEGFIPPLPPCL